MVKPSLFVLLALPVLMLATGVMLGNLPLMGGGMFVLLAVGLSAWLRPKGVEVTRSLDKTTAWVDASINVKWEIRTTLGFGAVLLHEEWVGVCELESGSNLFLLWRWGKNYSAKHEYAVRFHKRGEYRLAPVRWVAYDLLSAWPGWQGESVCQENEVKIYPYVAKLRAGRLFSRKGGNINARHGATAALGIHSEEFKDIREYRPGDPMNSINWKATSRIADAGTSPPLVNEVDREKPAAAWIFLDASTYMVTGGTNISNALEDAVSAVGEIASFYLSRGFPVGLHVSSRPRDFLHAEVGAKQRYEILQRMRDVAPRADEYHLPYAVSLCRREILQFQAHCYIITRLDAQLPNYPNEIPDIYHPLLDGASEIMKLSTGRRRRITCALISVNSRRTVDENVEESLAAAFAKMNAAPIAERFRSQGVHFLEWSPFRQKLETVLTRFLEQRARA